MRHCTNLKLMHRNVRHFLFNMHRFLIHSKHINKHISTIWHLSVISLLMKVHITSWCWSQTFGLNSGIQITRPTHTLIINRKNQLVVKRSFLKGFPLLYKDLTEIERCKYLRVAQIKIISTWLFNQSNYRGSEQPR